MEARRSSSKRVEKKGRFTITEIIPGSPCSLRVSSPTFQESDQVSIVGADAADGGVNNGGDKVLQHAQSDVPLQKPAVVDEGDVPVSVAAVEALPQKAEESPVMAPETHTQPLEAVATDTPAAGAVKELSTTSTATSAVAVTSLIGVDQSSRDSPPESLESVLRTPNTRHSARRCTHARMNCSVEWPGFFSVKRKGRFTIIELASDSPTSRKSADDLYDHRFVTTTSIAANFVEGVQQQQLGSQLSRSYDNTRRSKPKPKQQRVARSMTRFRQPTSSRRSRRRSDSPVRDLMEPLDMVDPRGNQQQQQEAAAAAYASVQGLRVERDTAKPNGTTPTTATSASAAATISESAKAAVSMATVAIPDEGTASVTAPPTAAPVTPTQQLVQGPNVAAVGQRQPSITISVVQFLQQQQTIAALIRQQHDLKQIISVLQEQQQQLITIPMQINELKRQNANGYVLGARKDRSLSLSLEAASAQYDSCDSLRLTRFWRMTRELYVQVDTLMRANDSLQSLLTTAEQEARHCSLEVECLSEENDELRHRCVLLESRYIDERKQSFVLEEELQRLRMVALTQQDQQTRQQQQQQQKLNSSQTGVPVE
ncbi:hypothetical protein BBJ28_00003223 [Nothophytophthora sp. Chile5]|nr:hypothetical protein BBJ28_00003223 [Nothophytophthora sp. Chile5]